MSNANQKASLKISQDVIETISRVSAEEIEGVQQTVKYEGIAGEFMKRPIDIKISDGIAEITISVVLEFGAKISDVCRNIQQNIKDNVQTMTGIMVSKVNVDVEGINLPNNKKDKTKKEDSPPNTENTGSDQED